MATLLMGILNLKPASSRELITEAQARKQGMIYEEECRVNWGSSSLSGDITGDETKDTEE